MISPPPLPPGRHVDLHGRGTTFVREVAGPVDAPTLLLLHGWTATADLNWFRCYWPLAEHFGIVALDHRGHGRGIHSRDRFQLEDCADDAAALITSLGLHRVVAVGYSMGGPIAQLLWRRHPELVEGLVLCATSDAFRARPEERAMFAGVDGLSRVARVAPPSLVGRIAERVMTARIEEGPLREWACEEITRANPRTLLEAGAAIGRFNSRSWLGEVDVPSAVVVTGDDRVVPTRRQERMAERLQGTTVHRVGGDHSVCVTEPERFVPALVDACRAVGRRVAPVPV